MARIESENLVKSLEQREIDVRAYKEEIEKQKMEKEELVKRLDEVFFFETCYFYFSSTFLLVFCIHIDLKSEVAGEVQEF